MIRASRFKRATERGPTWGSAGTSCRWCRCRACRTTRPRCRYAAAAGAVWMTACRSSAPGSCTWPPTRLVCPAASGLHCTRSTPRGQRRATRCGPRTRKRSRPTAARRFSHIGAVAACAYGASSVASFCPLATRRWRAQSANSVLASDRSPRNSITPARRTSRCTLFSQRTWKPSSRVKNQINNFVSAEKQYVHTWRLTGNGWFSNEHCKVNLRNKIILSLHKEWLIYTIFYKT